MDHVEPVSFMPSSSNRLMASLSTRRLLVLLFSLFFVSFRVEGHPNYGDALAKSVLFFQGQRSGRLPSDQKITWRADSGLSDGSAANVSTRLG